MAIVGICKLRKMKIIHLELLFLIIYLGILNLILKQNKMAYSKEDLVFLALSYERNKSIIKVQREYSTKFKKAKPHRNVILGAYERLKKSGSVLRQKHPGQKRTKRTPENQRRVTQDWVKNPNTSIPKRAIQLELSQSTVFRLLKDSGLKPFHKIQVQQLFDQDKLSRVQFCDLMTEKLRLDINFTRKIIWTDEAMFYSNYTGNQRNNIVWNYVNPKEITEKPLKAAGVHAWVGLHSGGIFGPYFFQGTVTGASYLALLTEKIVPDLKLKLGNEFEDYYFQQDGAPAHFERNVRNYLNETFPGKWIGRGSENFLWPPRSPDLNPLDYFFWGHVKELVAAPPLPNTPDELKAKITKICGEVPLAFIEQACLSIEKRIQTCRNENGGHVVSTRGQ